MLTNLENLFGNFFLFVIFLEFVIYFDTGARGALKHVNVKFYKNKIKLHFTKTKLKT